MYSGGVLGRRYAVTDANQLGPTGRERTGQENMLLDMLWQQECAMRDFITALPSDVDGRIKAAALTRLDELVMWLKKGIDA